MEKTYEAILNELNYYKSELYLLSQKYKQQLKEINKLKKKIKELEKKDENFL